MRHVRALASGLQLPCLDEASSPLTCTYQEPQAHMPGERGDNDVCANPLDEGDVLIAKLPHVKHRYGQLAARLSLGGNKAFARLGAPLG